MPAVRRDGASCAASSASAPKSAAIRPAFTAVSSASTAGIAGSPAIGPATARPSPSSAHDATSAIAIPPTVSSSSRSRDDTRAATISSRPDTSAPRVAPVTAITMNSPSITVLNPIARHDTKPPSVSMRTARP